MKLPRKKSAPRNLAARALRDPLFRPKVEADPKAYKRRPKHKQPISVTDPDSESTE